MDRISRKQRQLGRKVDNIKRIAAQEEKYTVINKTSTDSYSRTKRTPTTKEESESGAGSSVSAEKSKSEKAKPESEQIMFLNKSLHRPSPNPGSQSVSPDPIKQQKGKEENGEGTVEQAPRTLQVFMAIQDYVPEGKAEGEEGEQLALEQGQIVEVLDNKNPASWLVRTKAKPPQTGWVPGSYFETPSKYYAQRKNTRELTGTEQQNMNEQLQALMKREKVFLDLLHSEEEFEAELQTALEHYVKAFESSEAPEEVRERRRELALNLQEIYNFHAKEMLKGLQYHADDPGKVGQTFLEHDFEQHVGYLRELGNAQRIIQQNDTICKFLEETKANAKPEIKGYGEYVELVPDRLKQYEEFFKEMIKYTVRAEQSTTELQKALEQVQSVPKRAQEIEYTKNLVDCPEDVATFGHIYRHELFEVWEDEQQQSSEKYAFLFRNKLMLTDRDTKSDPSRFRHYTTIPLDKYTARSHTADENTIVLAPRESGPGQSIFLIRARDPQAAEFVRRAWLHDIGQMQGGGGGL